MLAHFRKNIVTRIVVLLAIASTGFGAIFLTALVQVMSGNVPETATASSPNPSANPVVEQEAVETKNTFDFTLVQSQGLQNSTVPQAIEYADYVAQEPDSNKRYALAHKAIKCDLTVSSLTLEDESYLKFLTVILAARAPEQFSGNSRYFMARNIVRYTPEKGKEILTVYAGIMCAFPTESPTSTQTTQENSVTMGETSGGETKQDFVGSYKTSRTLKVDYQEIGEKTVVVRTNDGRLNCRAIPQGEIVRKYPQNMELTVNAQSDNNWYRTTDGCWVSGNHVVEATQPSSGYTPEEAQLEASIDQSVPVVETESYASFGSGRRVASVRSGGRRRR